MVSLHSLANIQIYKSRSVHFCTSSHDFRYIKNLFLYPSKRHNSVENVTICKTLTYFGASVHRFRDTIIINCWPSRSRSRLRSIIFPWHHSTANVKIYKRLIHIYVLAFTVSRILHFFNSKGRTKSRSTIFAMTQFDAKYQTYGVNV